MLISLTDPDDPTTGELFNIDIISDDILQGATFNLFFSFQALAHMTTQSCSI